MTNYLHALSLRAAATPQSQPIANVVYTDNETWAGAIHPQALRLCRERTGVASKLYAVGFDAATPVVIGDFLRRD